MARTPDDKSRSVPYRHQDAARPPRVLAARILALPTREERLQALAEVPEALREIVRKHVEIAWNHPKGRSTP